MTDSNSVDPTTSGVRHGPLTWGQQLIWLGHLASPPARRHGHTVVQSFTVPPAATPEHVAEALNTLVARHESLRSTFHETHGGIQVVHEPRPVPLEQHTAPNAAAAAELLDQQRAQQRERAFDLAHDGLVRATLVLAGTEPAGLLVAIHHIAVDGWSWAVLRDEFTRLVRARIDGEPPDLPPVPWQPVDQAEFELSAQGQRRNEAALRYWERQIALMPDRVLPGAGGDAAPGQRVVLLDSAALGEAVAWLGRRYQVADSTLVFAAFAAALGVETGREHSVVMTMSSNRTSDRTRDMVACLAQYTVATLDLRGDPTFADLVKRAGAAMMTAYRYGQYDFQEMKRRERDHARLRGLNFSQPAGLNFKRYTDNTPERGDPGPPPTLTLDDTTTRTLPIRGTCARGVILLSVAPPPDTMTLELLCDAEAMTPDDGTRLVRAIEAILVHAVTQPDLLLSTLTDLCGLHPPVLSPDWKLIDNCWVNLRDIEQALLTCPGVTTVGAFPNTDESSLTAYLAAGGDVPTLETLHQHALQAAGNGQPVIAPHHYVICRQAPDDARNLESWQRQEALAAL